MSSKIQQRHVKLNATVDNAGRAYWNRLLRPALESAPFARVRVRPLGLPQKAEDQRHRERKMQNLKPSHCEA